LPEPAPEERIIDSQAGELTHRPGVRARQTSILHVVKVFSVSPHAVRIARFSSAPHSSSVMFSGQVRRGFSFLNLTHFSSVLINSLSPELSLALRLIFGVESQNRHRGVPITGGRRYVLAGFLSLEGVVDNSHTSQLKRTRERRKGRRARAAVDG
jgi:hypothetical protein